MSLNDKNDLEAGYVHDALGAVTLYQVNANGQVEKQTNANGGAYRYAYDQAHRLTSVTTPLGYRTDFAYGTGSDSLEESDSLGRVTRYEYDVLHNLVRATYKSHSPRRSYPHQQVRTHRVRQRREP